MRQLPGGEVRSLLPPPNPGICPSLRRSLGATVARAILAVLLVGSVGVGQARAELAITSFSQTVQSGEWYLFEGQLSGTALEYATVTFSGVLDGLSATMNVDGSFYVWGCFPDGALGYAYVDATDTESNAETFSLFVDVEGLPYDSPGIIAFDWTDTIEDYCVFTGMLSGSDVGGATVTFSGILAGLSTTADEYGYFSISAPFPGGVTGTASAQAVDGHENNTEPASVYVTFPGSSE